ncbi:MAG: IS1595 family transposase [Boseongicola sp.]|nr:IS1595 family transposase [Boseongicola sp.]
MSLPKLFKTFPDDEAAENWFTEERWPEGPHCSHCGSVNVLSGAKHKTMPYRCREKECRKRFSVRTGTCMEASNLGFQVWAIAIYLLSTSLKGVSSMKLHRDLGITQKSAWHLAMRLRKALEDDGVDLPQFSGPVEADETYVAGKRKNMSLSKRRELKKAGVGRGPAGKTAVVGVKDHKANQVRARVVPATDTVHVAGFVAAQTKDGAKVYTDEANVYNALKPFFDHESVNHSVGEYVREMAHTNGMESFWPALKKGCIGIYHKMSPKHLDRYVTEFAHRHNIRNRDTIDQMNDVLRGMIGKRLAYRALKADNGFSSGARS